MVRNWDEGLGCKGGAWGDHDGCMASRTFSMPLRPIHEGLDSARCCVLPGQANPLREKLAGDRKKNSRTDNVRKPKTRA